MQQLLPLLLDNFTLKPSLRFLYDLILSDLVFFELHFWLLDILWHRDAFGLVHDHGGQFEQVRFILAERTAWHQLLLKQLDSLDLMSTGHKLNVLLFIDVIRDKLLVVIRNPLGHVLEYADFWPILTCNFLLPMVFFIAWIFQVFFEQTIVLAVENELTELVNIVVFQWNSGLVLDLLLDIVVAFLFEILLN